MENDWYERIRWNKHKDTLTKYFYTLLESSMLSDCTLVTERKYFKVHKAILCACSPYFERLLSEHMDKHPILIFDDVNVEDLNDLVSFMYEGNIDIPNDRVASFTELAVSLEIKPFTKSKLGGSESNNTNADSKHQESSARPLPAKSDIPHASSDLTIPKIDKIRKRNATNVCDTDVLQKFASSDSREGVSFREGSPSSVARKKKRKSVGDDNSMENQKRSKSIKVPQQVRVASPEKADEGSDVGAAAESKTSEQSVDLSDDSGEWMKSKKGKKSKKKQKKPQEYYTKDEDIKIMSYIIENDLITETRDVETFRRVIRAPTNEILKKRDADCMKRHFERQLIDKYESFTSDVTVRKKLEKMRKIIRGEFRRPISEHRHGWVKWSPEDKQKLLDYFVKNNLVEKMTSGEVYVDIMKKAGLTTERSQASVQGQIRSLLVSGEYENYISDDTALEKLAEIRKKMGTKAS